MNRHERRKQNVGSAYSYPLILLYTALLAFLLPFPVLAWDLETDNKPIAMLDLMDTGHLAVEAFSACVEITGVNQLDGNPNHRAFFPNEAKERRAAENHLQAVGLVVTKHNGGRTPEWIERINTAARGTNPKPCDDITNQVIKEWARKKK